MGKIYFIDNDVILKLTTYRMLDEALDCFKIDRSNIRVLESARFVFGSPKFKTYRQHHQESCPIYNFGE